MKNLRYKTSNASHAPPLSSCHSLTVIVVHGAINPKQETKTNLLEMHFPHLQSVTNRFFFFPRQHPQPANFLVSDAISCTPFGSAWWGEKRNKEISLLQFSGQIDANGKSIFVRLDCVRLKSFAEWLLNAFMMQNFRFGRCHYLFFIFFLYFNFICSGFS